MELTNEYVNRVELDTYRFDISLNTELVNYSEIAEILRNLDFNFKDNTTYSMPLTEFNIIFDYNIEPKVIYYFSHLFKEVFGEKSFVIYICYASVPINRKWRITIGSYIDKNKKFTNISKHINPETLLSIDFKFFQRENLLNLFPIEISSPDNKCWLITKNDVFNNNDEYDYYGEANFNYVNDEILIEIDNETKLELNKEEDLDYLNEDSGAQGYDIDGVDFMRLAEDHPDEETSSSFNTYFDRNNIWTSVLGDGEESETAYWNTD